MLWNYSYTFCALNGIQVKTVSALCIFPRSKAIGWVCALATALLISTLGSNARAISTLVDTGEPCVFGACQSDAIFRRVGRIRFIAQSVTIDMAATLTEVQIFGIQNLPSRGFTVRVDVTTSIGAAATPDDSLGSFSLTFTDTLDWQTDTVDLELPAGEVFFVLSVADGGGPIIPALNFVLPAPTLDNTRYFVAQQADPSPGSSFFAPGADFREVVRSPGFGREIGIRLLTVPVPDPPVADAGPDQMVECGSPAGATVRLNGSGSFDPDGDALTYTWTNSFGTAVGVQSDVFLSRGEHMVTLEVDDNNFGTDRDTVTISVVDTTPPAINLLTVDPGVLWPPNHNMVGVRLSVEASDVCDPQVDCRVIGVQSSEPEDSTGDGHTVPDWTITGHLEVLLRAEVTGKEAARVYTVAVACTDREGNTSATDGEIYVPHDRGRR